jgi:hypothetical protein
MRQYSDVEPLVTDTGQLIPSGGKCIRVRAPAITHHAYISHLTPHTSHLTPLRWYGLDPSKRMEMCLKLSKLWHHTALLKTKTEEPSRSRRRREPDQGADAYHHPAAFDQQVSRSRSVQLSHVTH